MAFLGAPMIYYGNEAGMWGPDDPSNRQPMIWKDLEPYDDPKVKFDQKQFNFFQRVIAVRQALPALQTGFYRPVFTDDSRGIFAFARDLEGKSVIVVINRSGSDQKVEIPVDAKGDVAVEGLARVRYRGAEITPEKYRADLGVLPGVDLIGSGSIGERMAGGPAISVIGMEVPDIPSARRASWTRLSWIGSRSCAPTCAIGPQSPPRLPAPTPSSTRPPPMSRRAV
jgi:hypothetical protein